MGKYRLNVRLTAKEYDSLYAFAKENGGMSLAAAIRFILSRSLRGAKTASTLESSKQNIQ